MPVVYMFQMFPGAAQVSHGFPRGTGVKMKFAADHDCTQVIRGFFVV